MTHSSFFLSFILICLLWCLSSDARSDPLLPSPSRQKRTLPELVRQLKPSVVSIYVYNQKNQYLEGGSGFFISHDLVVSSRHGRVTFVEYDWFKNDRFISFVSFHSLRFQTYRFFLCNFFVLVCFFSILFLFRFYSILRIQFLTIRFILFVFGSVLHTIVGWVGNVFVFCFDSELQPQPHCCWLTAWYRLLSTLSFSFLETKKKGWRVFCQT